MATAADLWSLSPLGRPAIPTVRDESWCRNPIDAFILARLEAADMRPAAEAKPRALVRRAWLDLLGLPPSATEAKFWMAAVRDVPTKPIFERLVERLLSSPHYGECWARHWLDLVRYADSNGYENDAEKPLAWQYRDYVIRALNQNVPYDRFILEQLAGDELEDSTTETMIATGFYRVGPWDAERGASVQASEMVEERFNVLDDIVSTTSQVLLGLTMGCARCHDHKFDPLSAHDYYSMVAIFNPLTRHRDYRTELTRPAIPPRGLQEKLRVDARIADLEQAIRSLVKPLRQGLIEAGLTSLSQDVVLALRTPAEQRNEQQVQLIKRHRKSFHREVEAALRNSEYVARFLTPESAQQVVSHQTEIAELERRFEYPLGYFFYEPSPEPPATHLLRRGNPNQPGPVVQPGVPQAIETLHHVPGAKFEQPDVFTSRRRISVARWMTNPDNPLTARVFVNRVWQYHFGEGLVRFRISRHSANASETSRLARPLVRA